MSSLTALLHGKEVEFEFRVANFIWVPEQGEQLLFETPPVVEKRIGIGAAEELEVWFEPLRGSTTQIRGSVQYLLSIVGECFGIVREKDFAGL